MKKRTTKQKNNFLKFDKNLDNIWLFMAKLYKGNQVFRFGKSPYMAEANRRGHKESILGHQWSMSMLWLMLEDACPNLFHAVDAPKVQMICLTHDIGEIINGDIPMILQLSNPGLKKISAERRRLKSFCRVLSPKMQTQILESFDSLEANPADINDPSVLVAKLLDTLQGNHYAMTFGVEFRKNSALINKIVNKHLNGTYHRLIKVLEERKEKKACQEIRQIMNHHVKALGKLGVELIIN